MRVWGRRGGCWGKSVSHVGDGGVEVRGEHLLEHMFSSGLRMP